MVIYKQTSIQTNEFFKFKSFLLPIPAFPLPPAVEGGARCCSTLVPGFSRTGPPPDRRGRTPAGSGSACPSPGAEWRSRCPWSYPGTIHNVPTAITAWSQRNA